MTDRKPFGLSHERVIKGIFHISLWGFFCLLVSIRVDADPSFSREPENYFDAGATLSSESQNHLFKLMNARIETIERRFKEVVALEESIDEAQRSLIAAHQVRMRTYALMGAGLGAMATFLGFTAIVPVGNMGPPFQVVLSALAASMGGVFGMSTGMILASRNQTPAPARFKLVLDGRGEEILKAAEDLSAQIRGMAVPKVFWSMRRLQDFTRRMNAFAALEHLLLRDMDALTDEMKSALTDLRIGHLLSPEPDSDYAEAELDALRARIIRRFRELEYRSLKVVSDIFVEEVNIPFLKIDYSRLSDLQCIAILRWILEDPVTQQSELPEEAKNL